MITGAYYVLGTEYSVPLRQRQVDPQLPTPRPLLHNCCGQCTNTIKKAVTGVSGVSGTGIKAKETTFAVEGKFKPGEVVKALLDAGFYVQVKK